MSVIPDFSEPELDIIRDLLQLRYKKSVELHLADSELRLDPSSNDLCECPTVFWRERDCSFVIFKTGVREYRCQFFYEPSEQFGTGHTKYDDIQQCVSALLQVQSDSERERQGVISGSTGTDL